MPARGPAVLLLGRGAVAADRRSRRDTVRAGPGGRVRPRYGSAALGRGRRHVAGGFAGRSVCGTGCGGRARSFRRGIPVAAHGLSCGSDRTRRAMVARGGQIGAERVRSRWSGAAAVGPDRRAPGCGGWLLSRSGPACTGHARAAGFGPRQGRAPREAGRPARWRPRVTSVGPAPGRAARRAGGACARGRGRTLLATGSLRRSTQLLSSPAAEHAGSEVRSHW